MSICLPSSNTAMYAVTICFWPSSLTLDAVVAQRVAADRRLLARLQQHLLVALEAVAGEAEEDQHDAHVDDVAAVAALVAADEPDERGEDSVPVLRRRTFAPRQNSWRDRAGTKRAQREAESRRPDANTECRERSRR